MPRPRGYRETKAVRKGKAFQLRLHGYTVTDIAAELGCCRTTAWKYLSEEMAALAEANRHKAEQLREMESAALDVAIKAIMPKVEQGNPLAIGEYRKLLESRRKLLGIDAPAKFAPTNPIGDKQYEGSALAIIERKLASIAARNVAKADTLGTD